MMNSTTLQPPPPPPQQQQQQQQQQLQQQQDDAHAKKRTRVTPTQLSILEDTFSVSATPDSKMRKHLAQKLQMPERSIQIWFQNRRAKVKMIQRRNMILEEQEMVRAKIYAEAAAAAAASTTVSGTLLTPSSSYSSLSPSSYWYIPPPPPLLSSTLINGYPITKPPIPQQRSWSSDPAPIFDQLYLQQSQFPSTLSSFYSTSFDGNFTDESKEPYYHGNLSPSPTPNPSSEHIETETINDIKYIDNNTMIDIMTPTPNDATMGTINANAVTIGTWHRMKINHQDLSCRFQIATRTFEWYIRDRNYHFKMVISFDLVTSMDITILDQGIFGQLDLMISDPPLFYMENKDDLTWIQCSDFTEGMQATCYLHHTLRGLASDLRQDLLGMVSMDPHLCQIIRFPLGTQPINKNLSLGMTTTTTTTTTLDPSSLMRHQSLPLCMKDFEWSHRTSPAL